MPVLASWSLAHARRKTLLVLVAVLCLTGASVAQSAPASSTTTSSSQSQPPSGDATPPSQTPSSLDTLSPAAHPDATSIGIPTAAQVAAAGANTPAEESPDPSAGSPAPKPAAAPTTAATSTPAQPSKLAPKDNVDLIGQRNVGSGLDFYSLEKEIALGRQLAAEVESSAKLVNDPVITEYVNRIGQNLVSHSDARVPFTIKVLDTEEVNAFALPGGFFYVNSGLILAAGNEAELAGVMAHEIAHVAARHATKNMTRAQIWNMASVPLIFIGGPVAYAISEVAGLAVPLGFLKFSRDAEREADLLGLEYDYASGYDPQAFVQFFEKLNIEKKKPNMIAKAFATHPMNVERIQAAQDEIRKYLPDRPEYVVDTSEFENIKTRLEAYENGRRLHHGKEEPGRPVLLKRASASDPTTDSGDSNSQKDDGHPTLKRAPTSSN
ncbi:MAG TPA: M48 family metallopeptidase [Terriglobales bacterium]|nr:M48 family metallopeptidase [Terriglobales bacterium]